jgi:hypothetical protein
MSTWYVIIFIDPQTLKATSAGLFSEQRVTQIGRNDGPRSTDKRQVILAEFQTRPDTLGPSYAWLKPIWEKTR